MSVEKIIDRCTKENGLFPFVFASAIATMLTAIRAPDRIADIVPLWIAVGLCALMRRRTYVRFLACAFTINLSQSVMPLLLDGTSKTRAGIAGICVMTAMLLFAVIFARLSSGKEPEDDES